MVRVSVWRWVWGVIVFCASMATALHAQVTLTTLVNFDITNGLGPSMVLKQGMDGNFYGTTYGNYCDFNCGTFFRMSPEGALTTMYRFCSQANCADGADPAGSLVQADNGDFYGVTEYGANVSTECGKVGSTQGCGTIFKVTPAGTFTTLYRFCALANCADGYYPLSGLVQATNGKFYGTTGWGGANNAGTIFEVTPGGQLTTVYSFCALAGCADGSQPDGELVQATNGSLYGETLRGGLGAGTIFEINQRGQLTTIVSFDGTNNGSNPEGGLIQALDGELYGVTQYGGVGGNCPFGGSSCGTAFKFGANQGLTTLYNFCSSLSCADGGWPEGSLVQATDGNLYGTSFLGGVATSGTVFEISSAGTMTTLYSFCVVANCPDGLRPQAGLLQATNGIFYGTTFEGGADVYYGTIFSLSTGLGPFVKTQPTSGKEGSAVGVFGQGFTNASVVQFGGVQATNIKLSGSNFLFAKVPTGALTGSVTVTTGTTTLTSNQPFRVTPQVLSFNPPSGSSGTQVTITGVGFTQTLGVGFGDNVPAAFTVNSDTQVTATVPAGAKTGPIGVVTKGGTGISSAAFTVN